MGWIPQNEQCLLEAVGNIEFFQWHRAVGGSGQRRRVPDASSCVLSCNWETTQTPLRLMAEERWRPIPSSWSNLSKGHLSTYKTKPLSPIIMGYNTVYDITCDLM